MKKLSDAPVVDYREIVTTDATKTTLYILPTTNDTAIYISLHLVSKITTTGFLVCLADFIAGFENDGGSLTRVDYVSNMYYESDAAYDVEIEVSGTSILVSVTGKAAENIKWKGQIIKVVC